MKLKEFYQLYDFDEIMPIIVDMFPGTNKFKKPLQKAYELIMNITPTESKQTIKYKILHDDNSGESYMGAEDSNFATTWDVCLGKNVVREKDVYLTDIEIAANSLINLCFISNYPKEFEESHQQLVAQ
jgi:hypothetical protein